MRRLCSGVITLGSLPNARCTVTNSGISRRSNSSNSTRTRSSSVSMIPLFTCGFNRVCVRYAALVSLTLPSAVVGPSTRHRCQVQTSAHAHSGNGPNNPILVAAPWQAKSIASGAAHKRMNERANSATVLSEWQNRSLTKTHKGIGSKQSLSDTISRCLSNSSCPSSTS